MDSGHRWNHVNYAVPPERLPAIERCIDELFPWTKFVAKPYLLGYRLGEDMHAAALYFRPVPAATALFEAFDRLRVADPALGEALERLERVEGDWIDHAGFMTESVAAWEARLAHVGRIAERHPEFGIRVVDVLRPGDGRAATDYLYQAFVRIGLLGPLRNTFEMQARSDLGA
ncbi:MAG: hypothetical protein AB1689_04105 [Thermodesulfobacteriota bacterium]